MRESALVRILAPLVCQPMHASRLGNSGSSPFFHPKILLQHQVSFEFPFGGSLERSAPFIGFTPATLGQRITLFATTPNQMKFFGLKCPPFPFSDGYAAIGSRCSKVASNQLTATMTSFPLGLLVGKWCTTIREPSLVHQPRGIPQVPCRLVEHRWSSWCSRRHQLT